MKVGQGHFDVAILGSGFAGSILGRVLRRQRKKVLLIERGSHPRFALGESTTPLANLSLERLAARYRLSDLHHLAAHGRWLRHLPHLRRGLKRGFTFFHHRPGETYRNDESNSARLMVSASPNDQVADSHWLRSDVDHHLVRRAEDEGVEYHPLTRVVDLDISAEGVRLKTEGAAGKRSFQADYLVDATGPGGVVAEHLGIASRLARVPVDTGLLAGHFEGLAPFRDGAPEAHLGHAPFPEEQAAVHHLVEEGWVYVLPFDHGVASVGLVLRNDRLGDRAEAFADDPEGSLRRLLSRYPSLDAQLRGARVVEPVQYRRRIQHRLVRAAGPRWFLLPHAYAFFDPLFSTGMAWSLLAVERLAALLEGRFGNWRDYGQLLNQEADQVEQLIESAYLAMDEFRQFVAVALIYFAAVSYTEIQQRLRSSLGGRPDAWEGFLGARDPVLQSLVVQARDRLLRQRPGGARDPRDFVEWVQSRVAPRDLVGLDSPSRPNLYPMDLDVLIRRSHLLAMDPADIFAALPKLRGDLG